ncbi:LOW QUALITY PROTEIN: coiled-coil domain-containing protein 58-like [Pomacea canaliculata]|uniref:LOW QUALITY PROTEIN: coiled-coil domain-containing protein 58-like n=1 Tax=Pomacea canaliculata TaxID=400727 RepID=UPI000D72E541|nr:LOW QUALITY PROTEIN: coiled-coil domain-containing protein 58-like [Pomacea canaliculata]
MNMAAPMDSIVLPCDDFLGFQDALKKMRLLDDRIVNALNTTVPTQSFASQVDSTKACKQFYEDMEEAYKQREVAIKKCISVASEDVNKLRTLKMNNPDDGDILKKLRKNQTKLRLIQQELNVEEVLKDRALKVFYERCRDAYRPPSAPLI